MLPGLTPGARALAVVAHPDDESFGCGSLLLWAAAQGVATSVLCATRGEAGEVSGRVRLPAGGLAAVREAELRTAAAHLGVAQVRLLGYADSGMAGAPPPGSLAAVDPSEVAARVAAVADELGADTLLTLDASDGHRDHVVVRDAAVAVGRERGLPVHAACLGRTLMRRWAAEMAGAASAAEYLALADRLGTPDEEIDEVLDVRDHLAAREAAMAAHASQTSPYDGLSDALRREFLSYAPVRRLA